MSLPAIEVAGLSKRYVIEHESRHDNLRDTLHHAARKLWRRWRWRTGFAREEFWALRDVSFTVNPGEVVGIIGRNGAGKSTLLKVLSRITDATSGKVALRGRVASLLEVGTGFHPDLTGRENIFLNGAILGMSRAEIRRKFDEIVAFAEVERFLDTPVKRYSSGMYVRLAFAVAAHLEPEILIVDEVLAVGDVAFQKKCLGKMKSISMDEGRTVLFVSHQTEAVRALCGRCLWLAQGTLRQQGRADEIVTAYLEDGTRQAQLAAVGAKGARLLHITVQRGPDASISVDVVFEVSEPLLAPKIGLVLCDSSQRPVLGTNTDMHPPGAAAPAGRRYHARATMPPLPLHADEYRIAVHLGDGDDHLLTVENAAQLQFAPRQAVLRRPSLKSIGPVCIPVQWSFVSP